MPPRNLWWRTTDGKFPLDLDAALALPGIGVYTAAAVLSIAYDVPLAVLDGNVARVLARISAVRGELRESQNWSALTDASEKYLAEQAPADWNQALMELGEVVCTPKSPACLVCPVADQCRAYALGVTGEIPEPRRKRATVRMKIAAAVLLDPRDAACSCAIPGTMTTCCSRACGSFPPST